MRCVCMRVIADYKENILPHGNDPKGKPQRDISRKFYYFKKNLYFLLQRNKGSMNNAFKNTQDVCQFKREQKRDSQPQRPSKSCKRKKKNYQVSSEPGDFNHSHH